MKKIFFSLLVIVFSAMHLQSAIVKRALVIGIDKYEPEDPKQINTATGRLKFFNLDGAVADALSIKEILQSKYGFAEADIHLMQNQEASRQAILDALNTLLANSKKGDVVFFYYAGHGSQVYNSLSTEADQKDESIVPADSYSGVADIRDKELAEIYNLFLNKGVVLTVIFDSCHSGSSARGAMTDDDSKPRLLGDQTVDAKDGRTFPFPEEHGALIFSAAQDFESAMEQKDDQNHAHGAFTFALLIALQSLPSSASASEIFESTRAIMKYNGKKQEPVIAGSPLRLSENLLGISDSLIQDQITVAVIKYFSKDSIQLQGGLALGINVGAELIHVTGHDTVRLKIKSLQGVNRCIATMIKGTSVSAGEIFLIDKFAVASMPSLVVYIPQSDYSAQQLISFNEQIRNAVGCNIKIIEDPTTADADATIFYNGSSWFIGTKTDLKNLGNTPDVKTQLQKLSDIKTLYISFPPTKNLFDSLSLFYKKNNAVALTTTASEAQYILSGRFINGKLQYAFVLPQLSTQTNNFNPLPLRTDFITAGIKGSVKNTVDTLGNYSLKLMKIHSWLYLPSPPDDGDWPFYLEVKKYHSDISFTSGTVNGNDTILLYLKADAEELSNWDHSLRYVYVFDIDSKGKMTLIFPRNSSVENRFPTTIEGKTSMESRLGPKLIINNESSTDNYFLLASDEPIPNPDVLNQDGVKTRGFAWDDSPFATVVDTGSNTRSPGFVTPSNWCLQKITLQTIPK